MVDEIQNDAIWRTDIADVFLGWFKMNENSIKLK
jgi:hypothetical protein